MQNTHLSFVDVNFCWYQDCYFQFVLEGTVGTGSKGDIAVDDFTVLDGTCEKIFKQSMFNFKVIESDPNRNKGFKTS